MNTKNGELGSIPMPGFIPPPPPASGGNDAWQKAQQALSKVGTPKSTQNSTSSQQHQQQQQQQQYNYWMQQQAYGTGGYNSSQYGAFPPSFPPYGGPPRPNYNNNPWNNQSQQNYNSNQNQAWQGAVAKPGAWKPAEPTPWKANTNQNKGWQPGSASNQNQPNSQNQWQNKANTSGYGGSNNNQAPLGQKKFQSFSIGNKLPGSLGNNFVPQNGAQSVASSSGPGTMPESATRYVERAYLAASTSEDRQKVQEYLEKRLQPMIKAGTVSAVNWDREPLPHERKYQLPGWMPAASLRPSPQKGTPDRTRRRSPSPVRGSSAGGKRGRRSSSSEPEIISVQNSNKKKTKKQKKHEAQMKKQEKTKKLFESKKQQKKKETPCWSIAEDAGRKEDRARRFADDASLVQSSSRPVRVRLVKGTCQNVEKSFFRLTCAPDPAQVRPPDVLVKSLENVKTRYRNKAEYQYLSSQLRSIRQDLTVQRVRNKFTVMVYEINARISLEYKDREEFNKCQSQLKVLYTEVDDCPNEAEFVAYRLLYYIAMDNTLDISTLLKSVTPRMRHNVCMDFAMKVRLAVATGNYIKIFRLFKDAPMMCPFIMDLFVDRERKRALRSICQAYRPTIPLSKVSSNLGMEPDELEEWFNELEIECTGGVLDCRAYASKNFS